MSVNELISNHYAYGTLAEAFNYFSGRLNSEAWEDSSTDDQKKSLVTATNIMDRLGYRGAKTVSTQPLQFPRSGDTDAPTSIENACFEISLALLDGVDPEIEYDNLRMESQGYSNIRSSFSTKDTPWHIVAGIPSVTAWRYLAPYIIDPSEINMVRT